MRHAAVEDRRLAREVHELGVSARVQHQLGPLGDLAECRAQIHFLERSGAEHLGIDLTGEREHGRAIDVRIPKSGEKVRRPRARDREARRGSPRELAVGTRRE